MDDLENSGYECTDKKNKNNFRNSRIGLIIEIVFWTLLLIFTNLAIVIRILIWSIL